ncbi:SWIM zinc finger domain-containing protein [Novosphingobium sp. ST904]|uniref:SWIM zinc finger family protein n=1 Tax=Novosphingobium sp. ST904 TaxID=1684385 RepID=UPI0006C8AB88|nr:SWIM zinc finger family protein [Novosphingobium sp. ST904]KPH67907.1 hypothetical protein ADT71_01740 [Novosphingobium sp. ST904]
MIPELSDDILYFAIQSDRMVEAGKRYFQQGRVSDLRIDQQFDTVSALVRGSGKNHYVTSIIFDEDEEFGGLPASECTCPVGMGCKHVAAVLFALQASGVTGQQERDKPRLRIQAQSGSVPTVAGPLAEWLEAVVVDDLAMRAKYEELCFSLEPVRTFKQGKRPGKGMPAPVLPERYSLQVRAWRRWPHEITWRPAHPWEVQHGRGSLRPEAGRLLSRMTHAAGATSRRTAVPLVETVGVGCGKPASKGCCAGKHPMVLRLLSGASTSYASCGGKLCPMPGRS